MKTRKMSLANIQGKLSRDEMKKIMAGSGKNCGDSCTKSDECNGDNNCHLCADVLNMGTYCVTSVS